jgi:hypothetical protein
LIFLETNPDVRAFTIEPDDSEIPSDLGVPAKNIAASVEVRSGEAQYHVIKLSETPEQAGTADGNLVRVFSEADLFPLAGEAMRWLKLVNFCAAIRDEQQQETTLACIAVMRKLNGGTLGQILEALPGFDSQIAIGVVSRMVIQNSIAIDLSFSSFTLSSQWNWRDAE